MTCPNYVHSKRQRHDFHLAMLALIPGLYLSLHTGGGLAPESGSGDDQVGPTTRRLGTGRGPGSWKWKAPREEEAQHERIWLSIVSQQIIN